MNWTEELIALFDDPLLANVKPFAPRITSDDRLVEKFLEICEWTSVNGFEPKEEGLDFRERQLYRRLLSIRTDEENREYLLPYDTFKLLDF